MDPGGEAPHCGRELSRAPDRIGDGTSARFDPSQLFTWRRLDSDGRLTADADEPRFVPAIVADERPATPLTSGPACLPAAPEAVTASSGAVARGVMEIVLAGGCRVIVVKDVNGAALARVVAILTRS